MAMGRLEPRGAVPANGIVVVDPGPPLPVPGVRFAIAQAAQSRDRGVGDAGIYTGAGVGRFKQQGAVSFRGAIYHQGASGKLAPLNGLTLVFEWEVDGNGNAQFDLWEWKSPRGSGP